MRSINQIIQTFESLLKGLPVTMHGEIITSDGNNLLKNGRIIKSIDEHKQYIDIIIRKGLLAKECVAYIGIQADNLFDDFDVTYDGLDGMTLLTKNKESELTFIYMVSTYVILEQINKNSCMMDYHYFKLETTTLKHVSLFGKVSLKSQELITKKANIQSELGQNFFYDMQLEGLDNFPKKLDFSKPNDQTEVELDIAEKIKTLMLSIII